MKIQFTKDWIKHSPDFAKCLKAGIVVKSADCECGIKERHEHCLGCGRVISIGAGEIIREYKLKL